MNNLLIHNDEWNDSTLHKYDVYIFIFFHNILIKIYNSVNLVQ